ncbi:hypothetical protein SH2C18_16950 [Clostridium sediminicola]|uniref:glycine betaine ABC transporter substrate-binding protein n=1 Tax=Clostridium sediminicola TaxID=3114879 RepID=UPI0031F1C5F0
MFRKISIMLIALIMSISLFSCNKNNNKLVIASKPHSEQYILAEIITQLIEANTDIKVEQKLGIGGGTSNIHPAMVKGEIDIYPEYTGTGLLFVLKQELISDPNLLYEKVKKDYLEEYGIEWLDLYGFNNTFAIAVKKSVAEEYDLETYSDLAKVSENLTLGAEYDFYEREDGMPGLSKMYGFKFKDKKEIDIGLKYDAIGSDEVDIINVFSTDGLLKKYNLKVLKDDKNFFPAYQAATLIRKETLEKYPELKEILNKLSNQISDDEMIRMNYLVEKENKDPKDVAKEFLEKKGLL